MLKRTRMTLALAVFSALLLFFVFSSVFTHVPAPDLGRARLSSERQNEPNMHTSIHLETNVQPSPLLLKDPRKDYDSPSNAAKEAAKYLETFNQKKWDAVKDITRSLKLPEPEPQKPSDRESVGVPHTPPPPSTTARDVPRPPKPILRRRRVFDPVDAQLSDRVFPGQLDQGLLCAVDDMQPTNWFDNLTVPDASCAAENHYSFSKRVGNKIYVTDDCDGRVYYTTSEGTLSSEDRKSIDGEIDISDTEQAMVSCQTADGSASYDFYPRVRFQPQTMKRAQRVGKRQALRREKLRQTPYARKYYDPQEAKFEPGSGSKEPEPFSLVMVLVDSMSRANFLRSLPRSFEYLKNLHLSSNGAFQAFDFRLFNIVGSGTYENAPPIFTGTPYNDDWQVQDMVQMPLDQGNNTLRAEENKKATTLPSLWDVYHNELGAATCYAEEGCIRNTGVMARVWRHKVKKDLTPWQYQSFKKTAGRFMDHSFFNIWCDVMERMGVGDFFSKSTRPRLCFGGRHMHEWTFDYVKSFMASYPDVSRYAFAMMAEAHEASALRIKGMDGDLVGFLKHMNSHHPNTAVVVFGDHGLGYGDFSKTEAAKLEYKLPALFMTLPSGLLADHPVFAKNLRINQKRLVTGFDLYHTLVHFASLDDPKHEERWLVSQKTAEERKKWQETTGRDKTCTLGASLLFPVSVNRTCKDMDIPMEYCSCTNYHTVEDANSSTYRLLADLSLYTMNKETHAYPPTTSPCTVLELAQVHRVQIATTKNDKDKQLVLTMSTKADKKRSITSETFEAVLFQKNVTKHIAPLNDTRLKSMEVGVGWNTNKKIFGGEVYVLPRDAGTVWCVERWKTTSRSYNVDFDVLWIQPKKHPEDEEKVYKTTDVEVAKTWVMAWQPLVHKEPLAVGEWTIRVIQRKFPGGPRVLAETHFYIMAERYPGIPITVLDRYWTVKKKKRLTAYEPHRKCAGPNEPLEFCVCNTNSPWSGKTTRALPSSSAKQSRTRRKRRKTRKRRKRRRRRKAKSDRDE